MEDYEELEDFDEEYDYGMSKLDADRIMIAVNKALQGRGLVAVGYENTRNHLEIFIEEE